MTRPAVDEPKTIRSVLGLATGWLAARGIEAARLEAELLLAHVLGKKRLDLYLDRDRPLVESELAPFRELMKRRAAHEPLAWLTGSREFYGVELEVTRDTLVPRPETEHLVDVGRAELARLAETRKTLRFADVGTGTGCISIALLSHTPEGVTLSGLAVDASAAALEVARRNAERTGTLDRLELVQGDLLAPARGREPLDLVVSNPPYIAPEERASLARDVLAEPASALFDVSADLPLTRRLAREAFEALAPSGALAVETGAGRAGMVAGYLAEAGFAEVRLERDLAGIERVVVGRKP